MTVHEIEIDDVTQIYRFYKSPKDRLREIISIKGKAFHHKYYALNGVTYRIEKGETVGIIGQNGCGKSTLLKIICNVLQPTSGRVRVNGRISALLELGTGFNPEFTGRENVYMNCALKGLNKDEIDQRLPEIEAFAEIGKFVDQPVKTYSSGMYVRLAFSAAVSIDPDILVVDEALSVGDMFFQHKCISKMESFQRAGKTILLVTHDINLIKTFCSTAILLNEGKLLESGDPEYVTEQYLMLIRQKETKYASNIYKVLPKDLGNSLEAKVNFGCKAGQILEVRTLDQDFRETKAFLAGTTIVVCVKVQVDPLVKTPSIAFILRDQRGYNVYGTDTINMGLQLELDANQQATIFFSLSPVLRAGSYSFVVALNDFYTFKVSMLLDKQVGVGTFYVIENKSKFLGVVDLQAKGFQYQTSVREEAK